MGETNAYRLLAEDPEKESIWRT